MTKVKRNGKVEMQLVERK